MASEDSVLVPDDDLWHPLSATIFGDTLLSRTRQTQSLDATHSRPSGMLDGDDPPPRVREALRVVLASQRPLAIAWGRPWLLVPNQAFAALIGAPAPQPETALALRDMDPELARWLEPLLSRACDDGTAATEDELCCVYRNGTPRRPT
jgi:hypothetical protein